MRVLIALAVNAALRSSIPLVLSMHRCRGRWNPGTIVITTPLIGKRAVLESDDAKAGDEMQALAALHPMNRLGEANEVAELVLFLASDGASFITGGYHNVDGGYLAR